MLPLWNCFLLAGTILHVLLPRISWGGVVQAPSAVKSLRYRRNSDDERIVNGVEVIPHEFPSFLNGMAVPGCQFSLLRRRWGLTAGHCVEPQVNNSYPDYWIVKAGKHNFSLIEEGQEISRIIKFFQHPGFDERLFINDIALVKFDTPFNFSATIQPVTLPPKDYNGQDCIWVVGAATHCITDPPITPPNCTGRGHVNQKVDVPILSDEKCEEYLFPAHLAFNRSMSFCAGYDEGGKDACQGDSGGPAYLVKDGKQIQVGIVASGYKCALPKLPGIYTRVAPYLDWIEETIRKEEELDPTPEP